MIGGPLPAEVKAQIQAAVTSLNFIKAVGFDYDTSGNMPGPTMVTFKYKKPVEQKAANGSITIDVNDFELTVPILTVLPIPFIRVEETTMDFNAKIVSVEESSSTSSLGLDTELKAKAGWSSASLKVNFSYKKSTAESQKIERTYSLAVHVKAVQDGLPAGTERLLGLLENSIKEVPAAA